MPVSLSQIGSSSLCGGLISKGNRPRARYVGPASLLAHGPLAVPSAQMRRHKRIAKCERGLKAAENNSPEDLHAQLRAALKGNVASLPSLVHTHDRLSQVVMENVTDAFHEASTATAGSALRAHKVQQLNGAMNRALPLIDLGKSGTGKQLSANLHHKLAPMQQDVEALDALKQAHEFLRMARAHHAARCYSLRQRRLGKTSAFNDDSFAYGVQALVDEATTLLTKHKKHGECSQVLCEALWLFLGGDGPVDDEMKLHCIQQGLAVAASNIVDWHAKRSGVCRSALLLLSSLSVDACIRSVETSSHLICVVDAGLEALNRRAKVQNELDDIARFGGRELIQQLLPIWSNRDRFISLRMLNLWRRLRNTTVDSTRQLPLAGDDEQLPNIRKLFQEFQEGNGEGQDQIDSEKLTVIFKKINMNVTNDEMTQMMAEVDADQSGKVAWPQFLWMMSQLESDASFDGMKTLAGSSFQDRLTAEEKGLIREQMNYKATMDQRVASLPLLS